jgi:hypothetical protein
MNPCLQACLYIIQINDKAADTLSLSSLTTHTQNSYVTHTLSSQSTVDDEDGRGELPTSCETWHSTEDDGLWYVTACSLVERYRCSRDTFCHHQSRIWRHKACIKQYLSAWLHGVTFRKIIIFMHLSPQLQSHWLPQDHVQRKRSCHQSSPLARAFWQCCL